MRRSCHWARALAVLLLALNLRGGRTVSAASGGYPKVLRFEGTNGLTASCEGQTAVLLPGQRFGNWSLMAVVQDDAKSRWAVFEDFSDFKGRLVFVAAGGRAITFPKSCEPTWAEPGGLYRGRRLQEVLDSAHDLLGGELLAKAGDPQYEEVAACFAPLAKMQVYTFVGTPDCFEKVGVFYGGGTPNFDPAAYVPAIENIRAQGRVRDGLVGGWLPALRFVYPEASGDWSELVIYAPWRLENRNPRVQPVWYRLSRVEQNVLRWVRYFDSYHPFPPRREGSAEQFYRELRSFRARWQMALAPAMRIDVPDTRLADLARHSLVREMITRIGPFPKYGVFDRGYGGSEHDGFPDTFTVDTTAMLEWGLLERARQYVTNYLASFVRDDGSILYRGPETGQFGRMLTVAAQYAAYAGDTGLLRQYRRRLDGVANLLLALRAAARRLPAEHPAYGVPAGWSEADACLDPDPQRYMQPYLSNGAEAARGFQELGRVWEKAGQRGHLAELTAWGRTLRNEGQALAQDTQRAIARSLLTNTQPPCLPAIAGAREPFHVAVERDKLDPLFRSYRAYMELLYAGNLTREQVATIVAYRAAHHDIILGIPTAYGHNTHEWAGFLSYGHAYGLLQHDFVREYLLTLYSLMAHHYTRGVWTAPETRLIDPKRFAAPYCAPAQMVVPLLTRWMLVFDDPATRVLWLAKATPREWLADGRTIAVAQAPTQWGRLGFTLESHLRSGRIEARLDLPARPSSAPIKLRLRTPATQPIRAVRLGGLKWDQCDAREETITLPAGTKGRVELSVEY